MYISDSLFSRIEENEIIAGKFHDIEAGILSILNFQDFFEQLLLTIAQTFAIPHVSISIIEERSICRHIVQSAPLSSRLDVCFAVLPEKTFYQITGRQKKTILVNDNLQCYSPLFPPNPGETIHSMAITQIFLDGETIGSLNMADSNGQRFSPGMDTALLERLGLKISLCLSNVSAHEKLRYLAFHDPLTSLLNRRVMEKILKREFFRASRYATDLSLIFLDLDGFKTINDCHGHDVGDRALVSLASVLVKLKRGSDVAARFAGDEFVILLPSTTPDDAGHYMARVVEHLDKNPVKENEKIVKLSLSYGIASIRENDIASPAALLKRADTRLYKVKKKKGRGLFDNK